jgi:membrane associated rhomboid family serine protease
VIGNTRFLGLYLLAGLAGGVASFVSRKFIDGKLPLCGSSGSFAGLLAVRLVSPLRSRWSAVLARLTANYFRPHASSTAPPSRRIRYTRPRSTLFLVVRD